jgi:hypothetical protein
LKYSILRGFKGLSALPPREPEEPIRSELFSIERLEQHAESLAVAQRVTPRAGTRRPLASRLNDNGRVLLAAYRTIAAAVREERVITPAAEWLVDNFHMKALAGRRPDRAADRVGSGMATWTPLGHGGHRLNESEHHVAGPIRFT